MLPPRNHKIDPVRYDLRWVLEYQDGKVKRGMWSNPGNQKDPSTQAWAQKREGVIRASIEGKDIRSNEIRTICECKGEDWVMFKWIASASMSFATIGKQVPIHRLMGIMLVTRDQEISVPPSGKFLVKERSRQEQLAHYGSFGK